MRNILPPLSIFLLRLLRPSSPLDGLAPAWDWRAHTDQLRTRTVSAAVSRVRINVGRDVDGILGDELDQRLTKVVSRRRGVSRGLGEVLIDGTGAVSVGVGALEAVGNSVTLRELLAWTGR